MEASIQITENKPSAGLILPFLKSTIPPFIFFTIAAPLKLIQQRLQCSGAILSSGAITSPYIGMFDVAKRVHRQEGLRALWKGNAAFCLEMLIHQTLTFSFIKQFWSPPYGPLSYLSEIAFFNGFDRLSSLIALLVTYPINYASVRLANDVLPKDKKQFNGLIDVFRKTVKSDKIRGLYRGLLVTVAGSSMFIVTEFTLIFGALAYYVVNMDETARKKIESLTFKSPFLEPAGLAGVNLVARVLTFPFNTAAKRMMMTSCEKEKFTWSFDCMSKIRKEEGWRGLFRGFHVSVLYSLVHWFNFAYVYPYVFVAKREE
jgi:solute carrier family 25 (adenine nucleotide translocator) protein 4/5/6/31